MLYTFATARSIEFFSDYGAQSLCCPVHRVPIARIAAAQTEIKAANRCKSATVSLCVIRTVGLEAT